MPLGNRMLAGMGKPNPCLNAPTITGITKNTDDLNNCPSGWSVQWGLSISGTLQAGQEYYWERATDSAGTSWGYWGRGTATTRTHTDPQIGADGGGASMTVYCKVRAYVVPVGESPPNECNGPTTGTQASRTANSCAS